MHTVEELQVMQKLGHGKQKEFVELTNKKKPELQAVQVHGLEPEHERH
jgi:hypothetical protein